MAAHRDPLTLELLHLWCGAPLETLSAVQAFEVAVKLQSLAVWWLRPEVLELAAQHAELRGSALAAASWRRTPPLPRDCGSCWIALVIDSDWNIPLLQPALPLVLRWAKGETDDPCLPAGLIDMAEEVRQDVKDDRWVAKTDSADSWGLQIGRGDELDLHDLDGHWDSAWAPLTAGLLLAAAEGIPDPSVWASGSWRTPNGIQRVDGFEAKMSLAGRLGAKAFFLPQTQLAEAQSSGAADLELGPLLEGHNRPRDALRDYLDRLDIEPGPDAPPEKRSGRYLRFVDNDRARRYYEDSILDDVVEICRQQLPPELQEHCPRALITIASKGYDVAVLTARSLRPDVCLLLHDGEMAKVADDLKTQIDREGITGGGGRPCRVEKASFAVDSREDLIATFQHAISGAITITPATRLVADLTPGQGIMKLALYDAMPHGSLVLCIQAPSDGRTRRPVPFKEKVFCWSVVRR